MMSTQILKRYTEQTVRNAVTRFLSDTSSSARRPDASRREINKSVRSVIDVIIDSGWKAYIVGGTIRDVVLGPRIAGITSYYPRDIDIIVVGVDPSQLRARFKDLYVRDTRFGGLHLVDRKEGGWSVLFDVWALEQTWAFQAFDFPLDMSEFPHTPFLNLDTAAIEITNHRPQQLYESGFLEGINQCRIDINFEPNPYPDLCVVRALIMAAKLQFDIGSRLLHYILERWEHTSIDRLMAAQRSHYGYDRRSATELIAWIHELQVSAEKGAAVGRVAVPSEQQLSLWEHPRESNLTEPTPVELVSSI